jgi:hypothetical protein
MARQSTVDNPSLTSSGRAAACTFVTCLLSGFVRVLHIMTLFHVVALTCFACCDQGFICMLSVH